MEKITSCLWYDGQAQEAAEYYCSIFKNAHIKSVMPGPGDSVLGVAFELNGLEFFALNGGPQFNFTEAVSFVIHCDTQEEVDHYWNNLTADGGEESMCGWLKDKFGLSWQVTPDILLRRMNDPDPEKAGRVMQAMMKMRKIIIADIEAAYTG